MPLRMSYGRRTYRCLKKVIKKRQEERKKKKKAESLLLRKIRTIVNITNSSNQNFQKMGNLQNTTLQGLNKNKKGLGMRQRTGRRLTCPKKATRKQVPRSRRPECMTSVTLLQARCSVSYRWASLCKEEHSSFLPVCSQQNSCETNNEMRSCR